VFTINYSHTAAAAVLVQQQQFLLLFQEGTEGVDQ
jgi:hypothetical protein